MHDTDLAIDGIDRSLRYPLYPLPPAVLETLIQDYYEQMLGSRVEPTQRQSPDITRWHSL